MKITSVICLVAILTSCNSQPRVRPEITNISYDSSFVRFSIKNRSDDAIRFLELSNSWGYDQFRIECVDKNGKYSEILKNVEAFTVNYPAYRTIEAGKEISFELSVFDGTWANSKVLKQAVKLRIIYKLSSFPDLPSPFSRSEMEKLKIYSQDLESAWVDGKKGDR